MTESLEAGQTVDGVSLVRGDPIMFCVNKHEPMQMTPTWFRTGTVRPVRWECPSCGAIRSAVEPEQ